MSMLNRTVVGITAAVICAVCLSGCSSADDKPPSSLGDLAYTAEKEELEFTLFVPEDDVLVPYLVLTNDYNHTGNCLLLRKCILEERSPFNLNVSYSAYYENSKIDQMLEYSGATVPRFRKTEYRRSGRGYRY